MKNEINKFVKKKYLKIRKYHQNRDDSCDENDRQHLERGGDRPGKGLPSCLRFLEGHSKKLFFVSFNFEIRHPDFIIVFQKNQQKESYPP